MKFALDDKGKFVLVSRDGGWDLVVDDKTVFYCHSPTEAVAFMAEELCEESTADGVEEVVAALSLIRQEVNKAIDKVKLNEAARIIVPMIDALDPHVSGKRSDHIRDAALVMAGCGITEFRVRDDRQEIVAKTKAILEPWFQAQGF